MNRSLLKKSLIFQSLSTCCQYYRKRHFIVKKSLIFQPITLYYCNFFHITSQILFVNQSCTSNHLQQRLLHGEVLCFTLFIIWVVFSTYKYLALRTNLHCKQFSYYLKCSTIKRKTSLFLPLGGNNLCYCTKISSIHLSQ